MLTTIALAAPTPYVKGMKWSLSAKGGKAPPVGLTQIVDNVEAAIERYDKLNDLFDGTATITISDENGALATLDDLHNMRGVEDA